MGKERRAGNLSAPAIWIALLARGDACSEGPRGRPNRGGFVGVGAMATRRPAGRWAKVASVVKEGNAVGGKGRLPGREALDERLVRVASHLLLHEGEDRVEVVVEEGLHVQDEAGKHAAREVSIFVRG